MVGCLASSFDDRSQRIRGSKLCMYTWVHPKHPKVRTISRRQTLFLGLIDSVTVSLKTVGVTGQSREDGLNGEGPTVAESLAYSG